MSSRTAATAMGADGQYPADPQRFRILFLFSSIAFLWAGSWLAFAPIADVVGERFDVGPGAVNLFATIYAVFYIPSSLLGIVITETYGLHITLSVSGTVNALVCLIRWAVLATDALPPHVQYGVNMAVQVCPRWPQTARPARRTGGWTREQPTQTGQPRHLGPPEAPPHPNALCSPLPLPRWLPPSSRPCV